MATESPEATLVVATVSDANRAREAVDTLMSSEPQRDDLLALEEAADAEVARSARAP
jgi:hypothetical protein